MLFTGRDRILFFCAFLLCIFLVNGVNDEKRLIKHLLDNYAKVGVNGRPVNNHTDPVVVRFGLMLQKIVDFDERLHILTTNVWLSYRWADVLLRWTPSDFGGIGSVRLPTSAIWMPDIELYNSDGTSTIQHTNAVVSSNGAVSWIPIAVLKSACQPDMVNFPFDTQTCLLKFGSWTHSGDTMDLELNSDQIDISTYTTNPEFELMKIPATKNVLKYDCCPEEYVDVTFTLELKRRDDIYMYSLLAPCVLLSLLISVIFWMPPDSLHRLNVGCLLLLGLLYMQVRVGFLATHEIPRINKFLFLNLLLAAVAMVESLVVINMSRCIVRLPCCPVKFMRYVPLITCTGIGQVLSGDDQLQLVGDGETAAPEPANKMRSTQRDGFLLAAFLDRVFFVIYFIVVIIACASVLPRP